VDYTGTIRTLLIHGARAAVRIAERQTEADTCFKQLLGRHHKNMAAMAPPVHGRDYRSDYTPVPAVA
jgi:hypothetical protein